MANIKLEKNVPVDLLDALGVIADALISKYFLEGT